MPHILLLPVIFYSMLFGFGVGVLLMSMLHMADEGP